MGRQAEVTLHQILVHMATETHRHAGHADIVREMIDGGSAAVRGDRNMRRRLRLAGVRREGRGGGQGRQQR